METNSTTRPPSSWKVRPHGALTEVDDGILTVTGEIQMPLMVLQRRMTIVRLSDSRLVIFSAIALDDAAMRLLEAYGKPAFLVVPNDHHRLDAKAWKERFPTLQVVAPEGSRKKVEEEVTVDTTHPAFDDPSVQFVTVPGTRKHEAALVVRTQNGTTLVLNDLVGNIHDAAGFGGWLLRVMGFAGDGPHIPTPVKLMLVNDKKELREQMMRWADIDSLRRILVSHGAPIEVDPNQKLRELADSI
jgi:hypothetical protein